jgi:hypothetical protein
VVKVSKSQIDISKYDKQKINMVYIAVKWTGYILIIFGFITGLYVGGQTQNLNVILAFPFWLGGLASGMVLIGIAEIIKQLEYMRND